MTRLEDDVYTFGFILLEALVGPAACARREAFLLNEMVCSETLTKCRMLRILKTKQISCSTVYQICGCVGITP